SCTVPLPPSTGNIDNEPLFLNLALGDFQLQSNSPCINSGNNSFAHGNNDLSGHSRIAGWTVDIGAFEYQSPASALSYAWAQQYDLPVNGVADFIDSDADGLNNWQEWTAGTDPTDPLSLLRMLSLASTNSPSGIIVTWQSTTNRIYFLQRSVDLSAQPLFLTIHSQIAGLSGTTTYTDMSATNGGPYFYRVGVQ
ncbi:MAG: choice-of-anchor Q domain-containing protein, partial [Limisphaerales bacterium]